MLQIGEYLQSDNYVEGVSGWRLSKAGGLEMNSTGANGRSTFDGAELRMMDSAGKLRIKMSVK